jgi:two-component system KDP operon response regulator KdpE
VSRVLVVDDDPHLLRTLRINLTAHGHAVVPVTTGAAAVRAVADPPAPDVVVLDLGLPDLSGLEVLAGIRGWSSVPVIVLSARGDAGDKVAALDAGADDYVTKPFGMPELLARIRAAARRAATVPADGEPRVSTPAFDVDLAAKKVVRHGPEGDTEVHLSPTEWGVLEHLVRHPGMLVTQQQLLREVWGPTYRTEGHYLRVYLGHLRRKLEPEPARPRYLVTEPGRGYRFEPGAVRPDP